MNGISGYLLHAGIDPRVEVKLRIVFLHEIVQLFVGDLVALFEAAVVRKVLLHCVVGQMHGP